MLRMFRHHWWEQLHVYYTRVNLDAHIVFYLLDIFSLVISLLIYQCKVYLHTSVVQTNVGFNYVHISHNGGAAQYYRITKKNLYCSTPGKDTVPDYTLTKVGRRVYVITFVYFCKKRSLTSVNSMAKSHHIRSTTSPNNWSYFIYHLLTDTH